MANLKAAFLQKLGEGKQGQIKNEDSFEKMGLIQRLREAPDFATEYKERAIAKIGKKPQ